MKLVFFSLWIIVLFTINSCKISGCTDPRALNYNPKANFDNENSCEYLQSPTLFSPGVCYSYTNSLPTTSSTKATVSYTSLGNYSVQLSGLLSKKKYYARVFATNQAGTVYGTLITFTTL